MLLDIRKHFLMIKKVVYASSWRWQMVVISCNRLKNIKEQALNLLRNKFGIFLSK
jgi:hypothetical protein